MKRKASVSHDEAIIRRLRKHPDFAAEYLKAALEDEPRVLLALRHLAQAQGIAKWAKVAVGEEAAFDFFDPQAMNTQRRFSSSREYVAT